MKNDEKKEGENIIWEEISKFIILCFKAVEILLVISICIVFTIMMISFASANIIYWHRMTAFLIGIALFANTILYLYELHIGHKYKEFCIAITCFILAFCLQIIFPIKLTKVIYDILLLIILGRSILGNKDMGKDNAKRITVVIYFLFIILLSRGILFFSPILD